jgi:hypothetical protein
MAKNDFEKSKGREIEQIEESRVPSREKVSIDKNGGRP